MSKYLPTETVVVAKKKPAATEQAHKYFDMLWKHGHMKREEAYAWLAKQLGVPEPDAHMRGMPAERCAEVVEICVQILNDLRRFELDFGQPEPHPYIDLRH
jgi:hypothetical protein